MVSSPLSLDTPFATANATGKALDLALLRVLDYIPYEFSYLIAVHGLAGYDRITRVCYHWYILHDPGRRIL